MDKISDAERLIEIDDKNHPDHDAFQFCIVSLVAENPHVRPHFSHLLIRDEFVYGNDGASARRARLANRYRDGMYRVFRKKKGDVVLFLSDEQDYPDVEELLDTKDAESIEQVEIGETPWSGHAIITAALNGEEPFNAMFLKNGSGMYGLYRKGRMIILDNYEYTIGIMPIQRQMEIPMGGEGE